MSDTRQFVRKIGTNRTWPFHAELLPRIGADLTLCSAEEAVELQAALDQDIAAQRQAKKQKKVDERDAMNAAALAQLAGKGMIRSTRDMVPKGVMIQPAAPQPAVPEGAPTLPVERPPKMEAVESSASAADAAVAAPVQDIATIHIAKVKKIAREMGISDAGSKSELVARVIEAREALLKPKQETTDG